MTQLTTEKIVMMLPLEEAFKKTLLDALPNMDADTRYTIGKIIWKGYYVLYELKLQENLRQALDAGNMRFDGSLYAKIEKQTEDEMEHTQFDVEDANALADVRKRLEQFVQVNTNEQH